MQPAILCDIHLVPMTVSVTTIGHDTFRKQPWSEDFRKCPEAGCQCQYNRNRGYVDLQGSRIVGHQQVWCREHKEPKAVVTVKMGKPVWQCLHQDCLCHKTHRENTICVGDSILAPLPYHGRFKVWSIDDNHFTTLQLVGNRGDGDLLMDHWESIPVDDLIPLEKKTAG